MQFCFIHRIVTILFLLEMYLFMDDIGFCSFSHLSIDMEADYV